MSRTDDEIRHDMVNAQNAAATMAEVLRRQPADAPGVEEWRFGVLDARLRAIEFALELLLRDDDGR